MHIAQPILKLLRMFQIVIRIALTFLVINLFVTSCEGFRNKGYDYNYDRGYNENPLSSLSSGVFSSEPTRIGLGLSAWGIVTIIVSLLLAIAGMYYLSICYPILCEKSRNYDMIDLTSVV